MKVEEMVNLLQKRRFMRVLPFAYSVPLSLVVGLLLFPFLNPVNPKNATEKQLYLYGYLTAVVCLSLPPYSCGFW